MAFGKRQLVLAALVVALGAAVYLNWQFSDNRDLLATNTVTSSQKELGEAQYVNNSVSGGDVSSGSDSSDTSSMQDDVSSGVSSSASGYFANARLTREKSRDEAADLIKDILQGVDASDDAKKEALNQAAAIAQNMEQENNLENLIKAKGFADCVAFIQNGECSVVVASEGLLDSEAITIKDIVAGQTGISFDKIKIVEAK